MRLETKLIQVEVVCPGHLLHGLPSRESNTVKENLLRRPADRVKDYSGRHWSQEIVNGANRVEKPPLKVSKSDRATKRVAKRKRRRGELRFRLAILTNQTKIET